jgi:hypothetical protein
VARGRRREGDPARMTLEALVAAIHRVNPTERGFGPEVLAERYAQKARLQSVLIERFAEALVPRVGRDSAIVSLDFRAGGDAGHARIDALDDGARAWVRARLLEVEAAEVPLVLPADGAVDPLTEGLEALEAYDYPLAERCLRAALPGAAAGRALLELWVDCLADDASALAFWAAEGTRLVADPEARMLVAVAASRQGARAVALEALVGLSGARAAKAWVRLGHGSLAADQVGQALRDRAAAAMADAALPALVGLDRALAGRAATERAPLEQLLAVAVGPAEVEAAARALQALHPESRLAAQALADLMAQARREAQVEAASAGAAEVAAGRWGPAVVHLRAAVALGADPTELRVAEARWAAAVGAERSAAVMAQLQSGVDVAGLLAWLALSDRPAVPELRVLPWLEQLEQLGRSPKPAVRAVLALDAALVAHGQQDLEAVEVVLQGHGRVLADLPAFDTLQSQLAEAARVAQLGVVEAALVAAERCHQAGDVAEALAVLAGVSFTGVADGVRARVEAMRDRLRHRREADALEAEADRRVAADDLLGARAVVAQRLAMDPDALAWRARLAAVDVAVAKTWHFTVLHPHEPCGLPDAVALPGDPALRALTPDGRHVVVATAQGRWVFVRWLAVGSPALVVRAVVLRAPVAGPVRDLVVDTAGRLALAVGDGTHLLVIDALGVRPLDHVPLRPVPEDGELEEVRLLPGGSCAWVGEAQAGRSALMVIEPGGRVLRTFARTPTVVAVVGAPGAARVALGDGATVHLHEATGRRIGSWRFEGLVHGVARWGAEGVVVLTEQGSGARVHVVAPGRRPRPVDLPGAPGELHGLAALGDGVFVHLMQGTRRVLFALATDGDQLVVRWSAAVGLRAQLVTDPAGTRVALLALGEGPAAVVLLAVDAPPDLPSPVDRQAGLVHAPWGLTPCVGLSVQRRARAQAMVQLLRAQPKRARRGWIREQIATEMGEDEVVELFHATRRVSFQLGSEVAEHAQARFPQSAQVRLLYADRAARLGNWARVGTLLSAVAPAGTEDYAGHFHHLRGLSLLFSGAPHSAVTAWQDGVACPGAEACGLAGLARSVDADDDGALSVHAFLVRALQRADAARAAGDFEAVIHRLDHPYTWLHAELQSFARLTEAQLETPARTDAAWVRKARTITAFVVMTTPGHAAPDWMTLQLPATRWAPERIESLRAQALLWLTPAPEGQ